MISRRGEGGGGGGGGGKRITYRPPWVNDQVTNGFPGGALKSRVLRFAPSTAAREGEEPPGGGHGLGWDSCLDSGTEGQRVLEVWGGTRGGGTCCANKRAPWGLNRQVWGHSMPLGWKPGPRPCDPAPSGHTDWLFFFLKKCLFIYLFI